MGFDATALRKYTTVEAIKHVHHAGNSPASSTARRWCWSAAESRREGSGLKPRARIRRRGGDRLEPDHHAHRRRCPLPQGAGQGRHDAKDIDLFEINEAFAVVPLQTARDLGVELDRVERERRRHRHGAPARRHGRIILGTLLDELERRNLSTGLVTLCVGGGMGIATIIERV